MNQQEQMEFFYEIFDASLPRLGPGDDASTTKALKKLYSAKPQPNGNSGSSKLKVFDIGCGNGPQTLQLAKHLECEILAVDNHQPFLDELNRRAEAAGLSKKITTCLKDMGDLSRDDGLFDLIWSEGALNLMGFTEGVLNPNGFRDGLELCHGLLTPNGFLAVSEDANLSVIESCGFKVTDNFTLPESAWREQYCNPLEDRLRSFREKYATDQEKLDFIESVQLEIDIYRKHSSYYGYAFFVMRSC
jgi:SAM-dependent methyltransferase